MPHQVSFVPSATAEMPLPMIPMPAQISYSVAAMPAQNSYLPLPVISESSPRISNASNVLPTDRSCVLPAMERVVPMMTTGTHSARRREKVMQASLELIDEARRNECERNARIQMIQETNYMPAQAESQATSSTVCQTTPAETEELYVPPPVFSYAPESTAMFFDDEELSRAQT